MIIATIVFVVVFTILVALKLIKEKWYPYVIGVMSFGLVYSTTMLGIYVVGSDIQGEIYASRSTLLHGIDFATTNSPSIVSVVFAPLLSQVSGIDIIWVYKAILPIFLVFVPILLYLAFKSQIGELRAFYAALFFMVMPSFSMEITTIGKSMVAEFFYALMILAMVSNWKWYTKGSIMTLCAMLAIVSHYTIGVVVLVNLIVIVVIRIITNWSKWKLFMVRGVPLYLLPVILIVTMGFFYIVFSQMTGGWINHLVSNITQGYMGKVVDTGTMIVEKVTVNKAISTENIQTAPSIETLEPNYLYKQTYLTQIGLGLDYLTQPIEGQVFRLIQYFTQLLIILGAVYLLFKQRYKFTSEFIGGIGCSFLLLFCCMFLPGFSSLINMSRFYHMSLFFIAPMLIIGMDFVSDMCKWMAK